MRLNGTKLAVYCVGRCNLDFKMTNASEARNERTFLMKTTNTALIICAIGLVSYSASAQVTFNSTDGELSGLTPTVGSGPGLALPTYNSPNANAWTIVSPDNVGGGSLSEFNDTTSIVVPNGYQGASLGTLSSLLAQGAAGN